MKTRYFFLLAAAVLLVSCAKEVETSAPSEEKVYLTVGVEQGTKTTISDPVAGTRNVYWKQGDQIKVNDKTSDELGDVGENCTSTEFVVAGTSAPYKILYPASFYADADHVTLPAVQTYKAGGIAGEMVPLAGYSVDGSDIEIKQLCSIVKISVKRETTANAEARGGSVDTDNIACVRFKGRNSEKVSGTFEIDYSTPALTAATGTGAELEVRTVQTLATSSTIDYYLVIPARTYSSGFDIIVQDVNGDIMTKSKTASWTPVAGHLYNMPAFEFVASGTESGIEISNAEELVTFAQKYNNGDYIAMGESLIVTLTDDIDFSVGSANSDFAATAGIGTKSGEFETTSDNYFQGRFNGGGHIISNYTANIPLFKYDRSASVIENFTIDNTCSYTFTHANAAEGDFGAVVGYHKGLVKDVTVNADIALAATGSITQHAALGGIVGNINNGIVKDCVYAGNISVPSGFVMTATNKKLMIGGIAGYMSKNTGKIQGSDFNGTICNEGQVAKGTDTAPLLLIGGIVGYGTGSITDCETSDHPTINSAYTGDSGSTYLQGTIVNKTTTAYNSSMGGIIGENLADGNVTDCTNAAQIVSTLFKVNDNGGHILRIGGVAGTNRGTITGSDNNAALTTRSNPYYQYIGGIVGWNEKTVSNAENSGALAISTAGTGTYGPRYAYFGGIVGTNETGGSVSDVSNTGNMTLSRAENNAETYVHMGGVFGATAVALDGGVSKNIKNSGQVLYNSAVNSSTGFDIGGIVGTATESVQNVSNSGLVQLSWNSTTDKNMNLSLGGVVGKSTASVQTVENTGKVYVYWNGASAVQNVSMGGIVGDAGADVRSATNSGYVQFYHNAAKVVSNISLGGIVGKMTANGTLKDCLNTTTAAANSGEVNLDVRTVAVHVNDYIGGILGYSSSNVAIDNCDNSGFVHTYQNITITDSNWYLGGVVGYLAGESSISGCDNTGYTKINASNNTDDDITKIFADGGIAGVVKGTDSNHITVSDCSWVYGTSDVGSRRGTCGGIVAYAEYADISDCDANVTYNMQYHVAGGIVGWAVNSTITGCRFMGPKINSTQGLWEGGIVAKLTSDSIVDGCYNYCSVITSDKGAVKKGEIAGISESGTKIKNCHHTGTIGICSDSNFSDDGEPSDTVLPALP